MKTKQLDKRFENSWTYGDFRPSINAMGINGKTAWINVECGNGVSFSGKVSVALVKGIQRHSKYPR